MITRKELAKAAKRTLKKHFWILVVVCLIAAFVEVNLRKLSVSLKCR